MSALDKIKQYNLKQAEANQAHLDSAVKSMDTLLDIAKQLNDITGKLKESGLLKYNEVPVALKQVESRIKALPKPVDITPQLNRLIDVVTNQKLDPVIQLPELDLGPVQKTLDKINTSITNQKPADPKLDLKPLMGALGDVAQAVSQVESAIGNQKFPVPNFVLPYINTNGKATQVQLDSSGNVPVSFSSGVTLSASDIEIGAVELKNGTDDTRATITGANALKVDNSAVTQPVSGTVAVSNSFALDATTTTTNTEIGALAEVAPANDTASSGLNGRLQRIAQRLTSILAVLPASLGQKAMTASSPVVIASDQTVIPISDNASSLTVDAPVATPAFVRLSDGAAPITALPVTDNSGSITVDAPVGTPAFVKLSDGSASLVGQKAMVASLPVVLASDQASVPVASTLTAETTKVIGVVRNSDGAGNLLTSNSTTPTAKFSLDNNITSILGTAPTSVGKLDVKAADGDVFVRQATAANLKMDLSGSAANATAGLFSVKIDQTTPGTTNNVAITPPTLTKATQGSTGLSTQDLKDAGRSSIMVTKSIASTATTETLVSVDSSKALAAVSSASSNTITTGKRFRIQGIFASVRNTTGTTAGVATLRLRAAVGGATSASSPLQISTAVALPAAATAVNFPTINVPDGFEIDSNGATNTWGFTITHPQWVTGSVVATFDITMIGYEY